MRKKLNFILSLLLILSLCTSMLSITAFSYENDVPVSSDKVLLVNADTSTVVYNKNADAQWYCSYMSALMTFVVAAQNIEKPEERTVEITDSLLEDIPNSDGYLNRYIGKTLTVKDLLVFLMITPGNDAAFVLSSLVSEDTGDFVDLMNRKASELGLSATEYTSPGFDPERADRTTCVDIYKLYSYALGMELFKECASYADYVPIGYDEEKDRVTTEISIKNPNSPYYFKYTATAKDSNEAEAGMALAATTVYRGSTYIFVALNGKNDAEENVYVDAKKLTTWAYLNLSDIKIADTSSIDASVRVDSVWWKDDILLSAGDSAYRTVPNEYDSSKFEVEFNIPESIPLPVFTGQNVGTAKVAYEGQPLDEISLTASSSAGVSMLPDLRQFMKSAYNALFSLEPTEAAAQGETQAPSEQTAPSS